MNTTHQPSHGELLVQYHYAIMAEDTLKIQEIKNQILSRLEINNGPITQGELDQHGELSKFYSIDDKFEERFIASDIDEIMSHAKPGKTYTLYRFVYVGCGITARLKNTVGENYKYYINYATEGWHEFFPESLL
ncbi:hypothetical protein [Entomobacter blattae]|uniref:Uncharacterized protein n=1 Tax=Entomobacter blattae TaxID=2762277 RepID=A0A7H1NTT8_9PROT|nr:hypothetical protein [Entomobacter blattae]QNT79198.1 hypothetical protein JGUZn3_19930 [Entomobacter blattae]